MSRYWEDFERERREAQKGNAKGALFAVAWILFAGSITYLCMMRMGWLPDELKVDAIERVIGPKKDLKEQVTEEFAKAATEAFEEVDVGNMVHLASFVQTYAGANEAIQALRLFEEYEDDAWAMLQAASSSQAFESYIDEFPIGTSAETPNSRAAFAALQEQAAEIQLMQMTLTGGDHYDGAVDGVVNGLTQEALDTVIADSELTIPLFDLNRMDPKRVRNYADYIADPDGMMSGNTEKSLEFIRSYMLPQTLLDDAVRLREAGDTEAAINALRLVFLAFPDHQISGDALLLLSDIEDEFGASERSEAALTAFLLGHADHPRTVDGVLRYADWQIVSGDGLPAACTWLKSLAGFPPAVREGAVDVLRKGATRRGCEGFGPLSATSLP